MAQPIPGLKRVYEPVAPEDGTRLLVERLWPRGIRKEDPRIAAWLKDIAPSPELRTWFAHDFSKWPEFQRRYRAELEGNPGALEELKGYLAAGPVTFVYAAKDESHNSAKVLQDWLGEQS